MLVMFSTVWVNSGVLWADPAKCLADGCDFLCKNDDLLVEKAYLTDKIGAIMTFKKKKIISR